MSLREKIEKITTELLEPILTENDYELVDVEYVKEAGNQYLRVYVDKEGGFTVDDCEIVSRALEVKLDELDPIQDAYILEVSSPGLDRPLKNEKDFKKSVGKEVEVKLYQGIDGQKEFIGVLKAYDDNTVTLTIDTQEMTFERKSIAIIRLAVIF
jgi:ribosome maturation factor RimP